ncbi:MAG: trypsin-like peptidase domain-containing protein [Brevundimonas sp.]
MITEDNVAEYVASTCDRLVGPALVAIYDGRKGSSAPFQSGTGFIVRRGDQNVLVTAHHCLFGKDPDKPENPGDKGVFVDGLLRPLGEVALTKCAHDRHHDVAVVCVDRFENALPETAMAAHHEHTPVVTVHGFLSRDFRRTRTGPGVLRPKPFIFQQPGNKVDDGFLKFEFPRKGRLTRSQKPAMSPIPRGLSGSPILDSLALVKGMVGVAGVFTDWHEGVGKGATRLVISAAVDQLFD